MVLNVKIEWFCTVADIDIENANTFNSLLRLTHCYTPHKKGTQNQSMKPQHLGKGLGLQFKGKNWVILRYWSLNRKYKKFYCTTPPLHHPYPLKIEYICSALKKIKSEKVYTPPDIYILVPSTF